MNEEPAQTPPRVMESLQVLRALAALIVVMIHLDGQLIRKFGAASMPSFVKGGYIGVDVFFCLSGFILYYTMHGQFGVGGVTWGFLLRRFLRIYPIYWVATVVTFLLSLWERELVDWRWINPMMVVKSILLVPQGVPPVVHQGWTLVHEVKFYVVFGCLLWLSRRKAMWLLWLWVVGSVLTLGWSVVDARWLGESGLGRVVSYVWHPANLEFASGILAAWVVLHRRTAAWVDVGLLVMGVGGAAVVMQWFQVLKPDTKYHALLLFAVPSFLMVLGATLVERRWRPAIPRWLVVLGDASYSTYLFHELFVGIPVWRFLPAGTGPETRMWVGYALVLVAVAGGHGIHRWLEAPILEAGRRWLRRLDHRRGGTGAVLRVTSAD